MTEDVLTVKGFLKELIKRLTETDITGLGAQLAFFFLLSLFPLLMFLVTLLPYLNLSEERIYSFIQEIAPGEVSRLIENTLGEILSNQNSGLLSLGILATIWTASRGINALVKSLNASYGVEENRPIWAAQGMSIVITLLIILIFLTALILPIFGEQIGAFIFSFFGLEEDFLSTWSQLRFTIAPLIIFLVCAMVYWIVPNVRLHFTSVLGGAAFTAIGWLAVSYGFSLYINNFANYSATYGSIGGIIVLLVWLYLCAMLLLAGGQINAVFQGRREVLQTKKEDSAHE